MALALGAALALLACAGCSQRPRVEQRIALVDGAAQADYALDTRELTHLGDTYTLEQALTELGISARQAQVYAADGRIVKAPCAQVRIDAYGGLRVEGERIQEAAGILLSPPERSNRDVYASALASLRAGTRVLVLFIDGFGLDTYEAALEKGRIPNLSTMRAQAASGVYPTITPVNNAAMVPGRAPDGTGVHKRGDHEIACATLFDGAKELGLTCRVAEGDQEMLALGCPQLLSPDVDGDGYTDGEVFDSAMRCLEEDSPDLLFVHFHGVDDASHRTGPRSEEVYARLSRIDAYAGALMDAWDGAVIAVADHGQHAAEAMEGAGTEGEHGAFCASDLLIPFLTREDETT